jgi:hypothetical protein
MYIKRIGPGSSSIVWFDTCKFSRHRLCYVLGGTSIGCYKMLGHFVRVRHMQLLKDKACNTPNNFSKVVSFCKELQLIFLCISHLPNHALYATVSFNLIS